MKNEINENKALSQTSVTGSADFNTLSFFDGMSNGQIALEKNGIISTNYFACEIDKYAIQVTKHNYPNTKHIGDITKVKAKLLCLSEVCRSIACNVRRLYDGWEKYTLTFD